MEYKILSIVVKKIDAWDRSEWDWVVGEPYLRKGSREDNSEEIY